MLKSQLRDEISRTIRAGCNVKLLGDSLTAGSGSSDCDLSGRVIYPPFRRQRGQRCWASLLQSHLFRQYGCSVDSVGCYGTTSCEMLEHLDTLYSPATDRVVFCMIGTNNKKLPDGMEKLRQDLNALCQKVLSDDNWLVLMTPNPAAPANDAKSNRFFPQFAVADTIRSVAKQWEEQVFFIDHYTRMTEDCLQQNLSIEDYLEMGAGPENDGCHPGDRVYRFYYETICQSLNL